MTEEPVRPTNVRLRRPDGREIPVVLKYNGLVPQEGEFLHEWMSIERFEPVARGWALLVDYLPPQTTIVVLT